MSMNPEFLAVAVLSMGDQTFRSPLNPISGPVMQENEDELDDEDLDEDDEYLDEDDDDNDFDDEDDDDDDLI